MKQSFHRRPEVGAEPKPCPLSGENLGDDLRERLTLMLALRS